MSYSADSFVADEIPTTTKWNKLWNNDASMHDGTGIDDNAVVTRHVAAAQITTAKVLASGVSLSNTISQSIANSTIQALTFNTEDHDTDSYHSTVGDTSRIVAPTTGKYSFLANVTFAANTTGLRFAFFCKNGTTTDRYGCENSPANSSDVAMLAIGVQLSLVAGDYVETYVVQSSGGALNVLGDATNAGTTKFSCTRLGT